MIGHYDWYNLCTAHSLYQWAPEGHQKKHEKKWKKTRFHFQEDRGDLTHKS